MRFTFGLYSVFLALGLAACQPAAVALPEPNPTLASPPASASTILPAATSPQPDVILTLAAPTGDQIRPLLGVNTGPVPAGTDPNNADLTMAYRQTGVTLVRTHDFYGPMDMAVMYPNRTRDPADVRSYDFRASDAVWQAILEGGFEPYLRLGDSYNNATPPANAHERANWVNAAVNVVRHYRQGQWNGFNTPFRYVEIWNEPDNQQFWPHPHHALEYFQLYMETALALKHAFPDLLIGGARNHAKGGFHPTREQVGA